MKALLAIETRYSGRGGGVKSEVGGGLPGPVQRQATLPPHAAGRASQPGHAPAGAVRGQLHDAAVEAGAPSMIGQVPFEVPDEIGDGCPARLRIRRHRKAIRETVGYFVCWTMA